MKRDMYSKRHLHVHAYNLAKKVPQITNRNKMNAKLHGAWDCAFLAEEVLTKS